MPRLGGALLLSGIYDLMPLQYSFLQPLIGLTDQEMTLFSPLILRHDAPGNVIVAFGARETTPFKDQAADLVRHLGEQGTPATAHMLRDADHMTAVRDLGVAGSEAAALLIRTLVAS